MGRATQNRCHGDETRFKVVAEFIYEYFGNSVTYIADIAGGQGALSRILGKKYNYECEVIDPRHYVLVGVKHREMLYSPEMASYYDLVVGLHPDGATRAVVESALEIPVVVIPCCNYWDKRRKLNTVAIADEIEGFYRANNVRYERLLLDMKYPNICIVSRPPIKEA